MTGKRTTVAKKEASKPKTPQAVGRPQVQISADRQVRLQCLEFAFRCFPSSYSLIDQEKVFDLSRLFEKYVDKG